MAPRLRISRGNVKLGSIPSVSLPPVITCPPGVPCATDGCYAARMCKRRACIAAAWRANLEYYRQDPEGYYRDVVAYLLRARPPMFRWNVGGDCPDHGYCRLIVRVARRIPQTRFLAFSKRYLWWSEVRWQVEHGILDSLSGWPDNLAVVLSAWPGFQLPQGEAKAFPVAWLAEDTRRDPGKPVVECHGGCETCGMCWQLPELGRDVVFGRH